MISLDDEGFTDNDVEAMRQTARSHRQDLLLGVMSVREREGADSFDHDSGVWYSDHLVELVFQLLNSLPRSSLSRIQRNIVPLLQLDVVGVSAPMCTLTGSSH